MSTLQVVTVVALGCLAGAWAWVGPWMKATRAIGSAISQTGGSLGEAITPIWVHRRLWLAEILVPISAALVWFSFAWYLAPPAVVIAAMLGVGVSKILYPRDPMDARYVSRLIASLESRSTQFRASGDALRASAISDLVKRLRDLREPTNAPETGTSLARQRRRALAAVIARRQGAQADAALGLLTALMTAYEDIADEARRQEVLAFAAAAYLSLMDAPTADRRKFEVRGMSLDETASNLSDAITNADWSIAPPASGEERLALIRSVGDRIDNPFDALRLQELLADPT